MLVICIAVEAAPGPPPIGGLFETEGPDDIVAAFLPASGLPVGGAALPDAAAIVVPMPPEAVLTLAAMTCSGIAEF